MDGGCGVEVGVEDGFVVGGDGWGVLSDDGPGLGGGDEGGGGLEVVEGGGFFGGDACEVVEVFEVFAAEGGEDEVGGLSEFGEGFEFARVVGAEFGEEEVVVLAHLEEGEGDA